ncbi:hypothetical protein F5Y14DRAFT_399401 [Nemania sp. NC0429]|nr:hypothetical protein F5Y14DRAFT_399401 [Nemania sp. NC0429]
MDLVPFPADVELIGKLADCDIPNGTADRLDMELSCPVLDELYPNLDLVARKSSEHIDPIHKHLQNGRKITLTEDPNLHLVWNYGIVYIKPLPQYLLSHSFWKEHLAPGSEHRGEALGFMRSYERLIRHPSDFELAREARLIPSSSLSSSASPTPTSSRQQQQPQLQPKDELTYTAFAAFIRYFSDVADDDVSDRWHFGQIRLSRLNWAVRIFRPKAATKRGFLQRLFYEERFWQTGQFLSESVAPLFIVFAALSLVLSAMQVVLAAKSGSVEGSWRVFGDVSAWFAVLVIIVIVTVFLGLGVVIVGIWAWQFHFGYRSWKRSRTHIGLAKTETGDGGGEKQAVPKSSYV